jgi:Rrf2 family transcriptional regulator, iron-sulfur cluster assembly transcription factor
MKIDTKARSAIAAVLDIAIHEANAPVRLGDIAVRQRISVSYLEHLFKKLRQNDMIASFRGPGGGYRLNRRLVDISVADIIGAVDDTASAGNWQEAVQCGPCAESGVTDKLWRRIDDRLRDYLRSVTLESLLAGIDAAADSGERSAGKYHASSGPRSGMKSGPRRSRQPVGAVGRETRSLE